MLYIKQVKYLENNINKNEYSHNDKIGDDKNADVDD